MSAKSFIRIGAVGAAATLSAISLSGPAMAQAPADVAAPASQTQNASQQSAQDTKQSEQDTVFSTAPLNVRTGAGLSHQVVTTVQKGHEFTLTGETRANGAWAEVNFDGELRYVHTDYLSEVAPTMYSTTHLNVRTGAGMDHRVVTTVKPHHKFSTTGEVSEDGDWAKVTFRGQDRWVHTDYLTADAPAKKSSAASSSASSSQASSSSNSSKSSSAGNSASTSSAKSSSSASASSNSSSKSNSSSQASSSSRANSSSQANSSSKSSSSSSSRSSSSSSSSSASSSSANAGVWDQLAQCESGGNWSINTGNGYYGGLQFTPSSWRAAGGTGMPHQASKAEQIRVAENLKSIQGWGAWPACSAKLGLR